MNPTGIVLDAAPELDVRLLGQASVEAAGAPVRFAKRSTTLAMLAFVVLRHGQPVSRNSLALTLFPEENEENAMAELRRYLYLTNKALPLHDGVPWLIVDDENVRWNAEGGAFVDAVEFERLAADAETQGAAVDLYAGDLLEDVYEDWVVGERERLRALYLQALNDLVARNRAARNHTAALGYARRLLAIEPWREDIVRQAMAIRYAAGDSSGALAEYDRFATRLRAEMGVAPMTETLAMRGAILRGAEVIESDGVAGAPLDPATGAAARALPFVGREQERALIERRWDRATRGFGGVVMISGESGIGKTRLIGEIARTAEEQGAHVYSGGTSFPESLPYQCIVEALRAALPSLTTQPIEPLRLAVLASILPELRAQVDELPDLAGLPADHESARFFDSLASAVKRLASARPLLLVFEDLHWAADATIDALAAIARRIDHSRVLMIMTYREEETPTFHRVHRLADAFEPEHRATEVRLERFTRDDVERMIAQIEHLPSNSASMVDRFYAFSEGNALFLNEAIANVLESASEPPRGDAPMEGIGSVVAARTARLNEGARIVAEIAAVCGQGCNVDVVRDVAGLSATQTLEAFGELLDHRLMRAAGARDRFDYVFTHHLIRSSIYDRIDPELRVRRHARIAHVLEKRAGQRAGIARDLARHYDLAGFSENAAIWYGRAAREATAVYANDDAARLATLAIERLSDPAALIDALFIREAANARLGNRDAQFADLDRLDQLAETAELRCRILDRRIALLHSSDDREAERLTIEALRAHAVAAGDRRWQGRAGSAHARFLVATAHYRSAKAAACEALAHFENVGTPSDRIETLSSLIDASIWTGELDEADRLLEQARSLASGAGDRSAIAETLMRTWAIAVAREQYERALAVSQEAAEEYRSIGDRIGEAHALLDIGAAALFLSQWERARTANLVAAQTFEALGDRTSIARALMNLGLLHLRGGDLAEAGELFARAQEHYERLGNRAGQALLQVNGSFVALWRGDPKEAKRLALAAVDASLEIGHVSLRAVALANLGLAERELRELRAALAHMEEALALDRELGRIPDAGDIADAALAHVMNDELPVAVGLAEQILASGKSRVDTSTFPPYPAWIAACIFHWADDEKRARQALDWAAQISESIAASIDVPDLRAHFEALPFNVGIGDAKSEGRWPPLPSK